jgi:hypothetical protein
MSVGVMVELSGQSLEIARRVREIKTKKVKPLTRQETFKGV